MGLLSKIPGIGKDLEKRMLQSDIKTLQRLLDVARHDVASYEQQLEEKRAELRRLSY